MSGHPECTRDEIFVGNTRRDASIIPLLSLGGMKTARLGSVAYDIDGKRLPTDYAPVIISRFEAALHNEIMMERTFGPNWRRG